MPYPNILAFVEGDMEQLFLNNNFHYVEVISVSNGVQWSVEALCRQIVTFFKARDPNSDALVVWIDRERRVETAQYIRSKVTEALVQAGAPEERIHVLICDLMTENMILADEDFIRETFDLPDYAYMHEGAGGKRHLKELYATKNINYRETKHGVAALKGIRLSRCATASASVSSFLSTFQLPCWWLEAHDAQAA